MRRRKEEFDDCAARARKSRGSVVVKQEIFEI